jgi:glycerol-3-phosphate acyltransferase PlsY
MTLLLAIIIAYSLGSLVTGYYLTRWVCGEDIRLHGSGVTGATNVGRLLGKRGFFLTLFGDFIKGALAVSVARWMAVDGGWLTVIVLIVVAGHSWPVQLQYQGGKGAATAAGGLLAYDPTLFAWGAIFFTVLLGLSKSRGLSGLIAALGLPFIQYLSGETTFEILTLMCVLILLFWAHRENLHNGRLHDPMT